MRMVCLHSPNAALSTPPGNEGPENVLKLQRPRQWEERGMKWISMSGAAMGSAALRQASPPGQRALGTSKFSLCVLALCSRDHG